MESIIADASGGPRRVAAERKLLGTDHAWAGERFARAAGLDDETVACVGAHHGGRYGTWCPSNEAACVQAAEAAVALLAGLDADGSLLDTALDSARPHRAPARGCGRGRAADRPAGLRRTTSAPASPSSSARPSSTS